MQTAKFSKSLLVALVAVGLTVPALSNAAIQSKAQNGVQFHSVAPGASSCDDPNFATNVCIYNNTDETITFDVPTLNFPIHPVYSNDGGMVSSYDYFPQVFMDVYNNDGDAIFNGYLNNGSTVEIDPNMSANGLLSKGVKVTVKK